LGRHDQRLPQDIASRRAVSRLKRQGKGKDPDLDP